MGATLPDQRLFAARLIYLHGDHHYLMHASVMETQTLVEATIARV